MAGQHTSVRSPLASAHVWTRSAQHDFSTRYRSWNIPVGMTCGVLFPKLLLVWMFTRAAVCRLIRFCLACGDECVQLEDILAFPLLQRKDRILVYGRALLFLFLFFFPSRFFRVRIPETFPWFSSLNNLSISNKKQPSAVLLFMWHILEGVFGMRAALFLKKKINHKS